MCETFIVCQLHNTHGFFHFFMFSISVHSVLLFLISIGLYKSKYLGCLYQLRSDDTDIFPYKTDSAASVVVYPLPLFKGKRCLVQGWEWIEPLCNYLLCRGLVRIIVQQKNEKLYLVIYSQKNDLRSVVLLRWVKVPYCKRLEILASYSIEFFLCIPSLDNSAQYKPAINEWKAY